MSKTIEHVLPQIGLVRIPLYPPADISYEHLQENKEITRLNQLRHLGALSVALPGTRLARWDYTVALLYYSLQFTVSGFNSKFKIDSIEFSSTIAALQCASLIWNIGHLSAPRIATVAYCLTEWYIAAFNTLLRTSFPR